jgi:sugar lactone lactonase YvrE
MNQAHEAPSIKVGSQSTAQFLETEFSILAGGFAFTECPRWHDGQFYFSDVKGHHVHRLNAAGTVENLLEIPGDPSGLGFLPDGDLLVVSVHERKLLRLSKNGSLRTYADLSAVAKFGINDMVVDAAGRAYVGQYGYDPSSGEMPRPSPLVIVEPDGTVGTGPDGLLVANGIVLSDDGNTLICAESAAGRLAAYDVGIGGTLSNYRVFAELPPGQYPDGICLDAEGGIWVACLFGPGFARFVEGGAITHIVPMPEGRFAYACMLGGEDRKTLYMCTAEKYDPAYLKACRTSRIETIRVEIAGAGRP